MVAIKYLSLSNRITRLEDLRSAVSLLGSYAVAVDSSTPGDAGNLFTLDAALLTPFGDFRGRDAIASFYRELLGAQPAARRHFISSVDVNWTSRGRVKLHAYYSVTQTLDGASQLGWGTYHDVVGIQGDCAMFLEKRITIEGQVALNQAIDGIALMPTAAR